MVLKRDNGRHTWRFFRAGGFDQVRLDTSADFEALGDGELDQKLWVALACPAKGIEFDEKTLALIDSDGDGRIRAPEIVEATRWTCAMLRNPGDLAKGSPNLPLASMSDATPEGMQLLASAKQILKNLGKADATEITPEDTADTARIFAGTRFNGDGIVTPESAKQEALQGVIRDIMACSGSVPDRSGKEGVDTAKVEAFFAEAQAYSDWWKKAEEEKDLLPLKDKTDAAYAALQAVRSKVNDYFARCRLAAYDERAKDALNREESAYLALAAKDLTITDAEVAALPIAPIAAAKPLSFDSTVNPAWEGALGTFRDALVVPLLGKKDNLTEGDWAKVKAAFKPYEAWKAAEAGTAAAKLGLERVREILGSKAREAIEKLIEQDKALEAEASSIAAVHRLVRYHRDLATLLNNFVSFRDFYGRKDKATFQAGTLFLDQRSCDLCVRVTDMGRHATLAGLAKTCIAYCDCTRPKTGEKMTIAAAFTGGDSDYLMVGRNGIFYDRKGQDWDACITRIIENPISIRQAFWSPYKRFVRMIEEQAAKRAAAAEAASQAKMDAAAAGVATADKGGVPAPKKIDVGTVAALGVAVGAIGTALAAFSTGILGLAAWQIPLVFVGLMLIISGPSMIIAWLKLRQRNLGPILDANGWAVNAKAKVNIPFGGSLTQVASLPPGSERDLKDPYEPPPSRTRKILRWILRLAVAGAIFWALWNYGIVERVIPGRLPHSEWMKQRDAEKAKKEAAADEAKRKADAAKAAKKAAPEEGTDPAGAGDK